MAYIKSIEHTIELKIAAVFIITFCFNEMTVLA